MELADNKHVSAFTKNTLMQFGWRDGDPIPVNLGPLLIKLKDTAPKSPRTDVLIDINVINTDDAAQVTAMLAEAKKYVAEKEQLKKADEETANMRPELAEIYKKLQQQDSAKAEAEIIDDREAAAEEKDAEEKKETPAPAENTAGGAGPMLIMPFCQRCGYDNRQKYDVQVTDLDKQDFLASVLGNVPFQRSYELMGGNLKITFHTPLAEQNKMLHRQLVLDQNAGKIVTEAEWFVQMMEYRMALSLAAIANKKGKPIAIVPKLDEFFNKPEQSAIVGLSDHVNHTILAHEVTRRLVGQHLRQFQRLVEALEAMALEPSFWEGIDSQR
jgi:hypothetical protein